MMSLEEGRTPSTNGQPIECGNAYSHWAATEVHDSGLGHLPSAFLSPCLRENGEDFERYFLNNEG